MLNGQIQTYCYAPGLVVIWNSVQTLSDPGVIVTFQYQSTNTVVWQFKKDSVVANQVDYTVSVDAGPTQSGIVQ